MRSLEFILIVICTVSPFLFSIGLIDYRKKEISLAIIFIFIFHLLFEGYRWQLIPCFFLWILVLVMLFNNWKLKRNRITHIVYVFCLILFLIIPAWILPIILPVFTLPEPSGDYQIGSRNLLIKTPFDEIITDNTEDRREFMVKVWYPAIISNEPKEVYLDKGNRAGFSNKYGIPESFMNYLDHIKTNTFVSPEIQNKKFPVLIFSHGLYSEAFGYYALMEEIVSHGFIVLNINHTYESSGSLFPDGEILLFHSEFDEKNNNSTMAEMAWVASQNYWNASTLDIRYSAVEDLIRNYVGAEITERWSKDIKALIDYLEEMNLDTFLYNHVDLLKIGVFGHSQGGSAVGQVMLIDERISSGINLDGVQWGEMMDNTISRPLLLISSEWPEDHMDLNQFAYRNIPKSNFQKITIKDSGHSNFMDIPLMIKIPAINEAGSIDPKKGHSEISGLIIEFFNETLISGNEPK